jgi:NAD(P)-dependent dehydrogenase (short-subunit alcohol dehydrogenase family)
VETGLEGRTALVTGAASGIGRACCEALAAEGAKVVCSDLDASGAESVAGLVGGHALAADVTRPEDVRRLVSKAVELGGSLDVLVASHGIFHATPLPSIAVDEWDQLQAVNLRGTFLLCQAALEKMAQRPGGSIVTIASLAGQVGGLQAGAGYAASKAGVAALTKSLARYAGPHGVRVNCVNPGFIDTPMTRGWPAEARDAVIARTPLGRMGRAEEVAEAVVWLASDRAAFVHGAHLDVNGGLHMD